MYTYIVYFSSSQFHVTRKGAPIPYKKALLEEKITFSLSPVILAWIQIFSGVCDREKKVSLSLSALFPLLVESE